MVVEQLISEFVAAVRPVWDAVCMPAAPLFAFFCLRIFSFRFDRRYQNLILLFSGVLCGLAIFGLDQTLYLAGAAGGGGGYLRITLITAVFTIAWALILYWGDQALIALTTLLLYNVFSAVRFVFLGLITALLPDLTIIEGVAAAILPTVPVCAGSYLFIARVQKRAVSGFTRPESVGWFAVALATMLIMCAQCENAEFGWPFIPMGLNVIFTSGAIYCLIFLYSRQKFIASEQQKILGNMERYEGYLEQMKELDTHMSAIRHELKNHIFYIDQLLERRDYAALKEYVGRLRDVEPDAVHIVSTRNSVVDAIINSKCGYAQALGIRTEAHAVLPEVLRIDGLSLCSVLGNLLTNAIEGAVKTENPFLRVDMRPYKDYLVIVVKNTAARDVIKENPRLLTTKKNAENHGIGLKVVEQVADWREGTLRLEMEEGYVFTASVMLKNMDISGPRKN